MERFFLFDERSALFNLYNALQAANLQGISMYAPQGLLQASLTVVLGHNRPDYLPVTLSGLMTKVIQDQPIAPGEGINRLVLTVVYPDSRFQWFYPCIGRFHPLPAFSFPYEGMAWIHS